jgi:putative DNA primase/helicase
MTDGGDDVAGAVRAGLRKGKRAANARKRARPEPNGHDAPESVVDDTPESPVVIDTPDDAPESADHLDDAESRVRDMAKLSLIEYARVRVGVADRIGVPVGWLDKCVQAERSGVDALIGQGRPVEFPAPEPWPEAVDGAALLTDLTTFFGDHLVLPERGAVTMALWSLHTWVFDVFRMTPRLNFRSAMRRSGKTTGLDLLGMTCASPLRAENISEAAMFRVTERHRPTLLLDEADRFLRGKDDLIGLLNAGHAVNGQAIRVVGDDHEPRSFSSFAPLAIAGIGALPGTLDDRSIVITMARATRAEAKDKKRVTSETEREGTKLARRAARWAEDNREKLNLDPAMGDLFSREADKWRPLYAIAERAGDTWPDLAKKAAKALAGNDTDLIEALLTDIRGVFEDAFKDVDADKREMRSVDLAACLNALIDRPWADFNRGNGITTNRLARLLAPLAVVPNWIGPEGKRAKGYRLKQFDAAFARYLPPSEGEG